MPQPKPCTLSDSRFVSEFDLKDSDPIDLFVDNTSAIDVAYNPEHHDKMKHVERRHFYVRDMVEKFELQVPYCPTDENVADFLTKPLDSKKFS